MRTINDEWQKNMQKLIMLSGSIKIVPDIGEIDTDILNSLKNILWAELYSRDGEEYRNEYD